MATLLCNVTNSQLSSRCQCYPCSLYNATQSNTILVSIFNGKRFNVNLLFISKSYLPFFNRLTDNPSKTNDYILYKLRENLLNQKVKYRYSEVALEYICLVTQLTIKDVNAHIMRLLFSFLY